MHILVLIIGALSAAAFWYYRLKMIGDAARDAAKVAGGIANMPRKLRFRRRAGQTGLRAVDDPMEAAAIMMQLVAGAYGGQLPGDAAAAIMRREITESFDLDEEQAGELITHAAWMVRKVEAPLGLMNAMSRVLLASDRISAKELIDLDAMFIAISEAEGVPGGEALDLLQAYRNQVGLQA